MKVFVLLTLILFFEKARSQAVEVTLGPAAPAAVNEGDPMTVMCSVVAPAVGDIVVDLELSAAGVGTTAEDGYDTDPPIRNYQCIIPHNAMMGTVDIPTIVDNVADDGDIYLIHGTPVAPNTIATTPVPMFTLTDVPSGLGTLVKAVVKQVDYEVAEGAGTLTLLVEFEDESEEPKPAPIEADYQLGFTFSDDTATGGTTGASPHDYDNTVVAADNLIAGTNGMGVISTTLTIGVTSDTDIENAERFIFRLLADGGAGMVVDTTTVYTVTIFDDDKPGIHILNPFAALPRRSKKTAKQFVFTGEANGGIELVMDPRQTACRTKNIVDINNGKEYQFPRPPPRSRTRTRFTEYTFSTTETINAIDYDLVAVSHISATNHKSGSAPINAWEGSTMTVYPGAGEDLEKPVTITVEAKDVKLTRDLRWSFYDATGVEKRLRDNNGKNSFTVTLQSQAGLYAIYRPTRGQRGWVQYVRVILSDCPEGMYTVTTACDTGPIVCEHGGIVDPAYSAGLCTCPPGFIGPLCQYPIHGGRFGHSGQYDVSTFVEGNGRYVTFSFKLPFGNTCAAGYHGPGCEKKCPQNYFGAGCTFRCHCADDLCSSTGVCANGCAAGFDGPTCQP